MYSTGANPSPRDVRTFTYTPSVIVQIGGKRYLSEDIENQWYEGICTAISLTQNARKATGIKYSADFQYLMQKLMEGNWDEGSSIFTAMKVGKNIGFLPASFWTFSTEADRKLPYHEYIKKLQQALPALETLKAVASLNRLAAYAKVPVDRDSMAHAIAESAAGVLCRYDVGKEWWSAPIEPLRAPKLVISGHAVTECNFVGDSSRIANTWGPEWADKGTAYRLWSMYKPTEAWIPYYKTVPPDIQKQLDSRTGAWGKLLNIVQKLIKLAYA